MALIKEEPAKLKPLIFVADSDDESIITIQAGLKKLTERIEAFRTPEKFLQRLKSVKPNICLVDLQFGPRGTGFQLIKAVRSVFGPEFPLMVTSTAADPESIAHAIEMGANDYIVKPVDPDILHAKILNYVNPQETSQGGFAFFTVPFAIAGASISVEIAVIGVDELGIRLGSKHKLRKGAFVKISGPMVAELTGKADPVSVTIETTAVDTASDRYTAYATFDAADEQLMRNIRRWLAERLGKPPLTAP